MSTIRAVIFDLGGVVFGSPLHAIAAYERDRGIPDGFVNHVVVDTAPEGAWSRLERGELSLDTFFPLFESECAAAGHEISAREMFQRMDAATKPRPQMIAAISRLRACAYRVAALTNNWARDDREAEGAALRDHFDVFVESAVLGMRKPDPKIYEHACRELEVGLDEAAFLDDIGTNLKSARALGMHTIKVDDPDVALAELGALLGDPRLRLGSPQGTN